MTREQFSEKLKENRTRTGYSQTEVALKIGRPQQTIASWESGKGQPDPDTLVKLLKIYGVSPNHFFEYKEADSFSPAESEHIKKYRTLDEYGKESVDVVLDVEYKRCQNAAQSAPVITLPVLGMTAEEPVRVLWLPEPIQPAAAGLGQPADDEETENVPVVYNDTTRRADYILRVSGDSMEPENNDGDRVLVRTQPAVEIGEIGIFIRDGERYVKIYRGDHLESINPKYGPMEFRGFSECKGLVVGVLNPKWIVEK